MLFIEHHFYNFSFSYFLKIKFLLPIYVPVSFYYIIPSLSYGLFQYEKNHLYLIKGNNKDKAIN